jgi:hypothetical protein
VATAGELHPRQILSVFGRKHNASPGGMAVKRSLQTSETAPIIHNHAFHSSLMVSGNSLIFNIP